MEFNKKLAYLNEDDEIQGFYLLKEAEVKNGTSGRPYLNAVLSDSSGAVQAHIWDYSGNIERETGNVVKLRARAELYRGVIQLNISKIRPTTYEDEYSLNDIIPTAPIDSFKEIEYVRGIVESIADEDYKAICERMLDKHIVSFSKLPAAKSVHHSFISGLLMHTANMLRIADFLATEIYPYAVDRSLLLAGTLLHDFAKEKEYSVTQLGLVDDTTVDGMLLGHLVMGAEEIGEIGDSLGISHEKTTLLKHMLLSHHGQPEFGAAVKPCIAESELLSYIDMLDSRMEIYAENFEHMELGQVSDRIWSLDKKIYNHR